MPDIFDEVDEDLRADRLRNLLKRYGGAMIAAVVLVVVAIGGYEQWKTIDARHAGQVAQQFLAAMRDAEAHGEATRQNAEKEFAAIAGQSRHGYAVLAELQEAALKAQAGDLAGASALWDQVAGDSAADPLLRGAADLAWVMHHVDAGDAAAVEARLKPLLAPDNAWHALAEEQQALLALRLGKTEEARTSLKQLAQDMTAPEGVRRRADGLLARLGS